MSTITLSEIKATQTKLAEMIAAFEVENSVQTYVLPEAEFELQPGEHYAGIIIGNGGEQSYHLILLAGEAESVTHAEALEWAAELGGELPTRREQALLFANLQGQFASAWYWSGQLHESVPDYAWLQHFGYGYQDDSLRYGKLRARAVRRLIIH